MKYFTGQVKVSDVHFDENLLTIHLSDGREISVRLDHISWLEWLLKATPDQRVQWSIEPRGAAIYWEELDDGIELSHLLGMQPLE